MRLGDAIQKRRGGGKRTRRGKRSDAGRSPLTGARFARWLFGLALVGLAVGYAVATRVLFPAPPPPQELVEVPGVQGLALSRAREQLVEGDLDLGVVEGLRHPELDSGVVVGQSPLSGQLARRGQPVRLTVSLGPQRQAIPDVVRLRGDRARGVLEATGLEVIVDSVEAELPTGAVVAIEPEVGTVLRVPGEVLLTLSRGPPLIPMPYLLGIPAEQAIDSLRLLGLEVAVVDTVFRFGRDQGLVVEQDPPADSLVERDAGVRLSVGRRGGG